jgi:hypothetical protein
MTQHSRRSFLGLFSAISAAVAAGVRLPDAPAKAAEMAPVMEPEFVQPPEKWSSRVLEAKLREMLKECVAVSWSRHDAVGELAKTTVVYKKASGIPHIFPQRSEWEKGCPASVSFHDYEEHIPDYAPDGIARRMLVGDSQREITVEWVHE